MSPTLLGYLYLIQPREFLGTNIYKVGRTHSIIDRLRQYPKGSELHGVTLVSDMQSGERLLLHHLRDYIVRDYGLEYVDCPYSILFSHLYQVQQAYPINGSPVSPPREVISPRDMLTYISKYMETEHKEYLTEGILIPSYELYEGFRAWCESHDRYMSGYPLKSFLVDIKLLYNVKERVSTLNDEVHRVLCFPERQRPVLFKFLGDMLVDYDGDMLKLTWKELSHRYKDWLLSKGDYKTVVPSTRGLSDEFRYKFQKGEYIKKRFGGGGSRGCEIIVDKMLKTVR